MKIQDFTMINNLVVGVTTVAFSKNQTLIAQLQDKGFKKVLTNVNGKRFTKSELISILSKCDVAIVGLDEIDKSVLSQTTKLKAISKYGVGLNNINFEDCKKYNVGGQHVDMMSMMKGGCHHSNALGMQARCCAIGNT